MDALKHIYTTETESDAFALAASHKTFIAGGDWPDWLEDDVSDVKDGISKLNALSSGLRFATESATAMSEIDSTSPGNVSAAGSGVVFLVHGRDTAARETVARFLESAGNQRLVILHEQPNRGQTLIEKFEKHATSAKYAVVLLTADDEGAGQGDVPRPRARQNVVFELGFFFGRLGRDRVAVLYESDVELPSDVDGLAYISLAKNWQAELVRDLRDAGLDFSLDRALNASDE
jgi:predicted nucleotide-binding protein